MEMRVRRILSCPQCVSWSSLCSNEDSGQDLGYNGLGSNGKMGPRGRDLDSAAPEPGTEMEETLKQRRGDEKDRPRQKET